MPVPRRTATRSDVRWLALTNDSGVGLLAVGMPLLSVAARHCGTADLEGIRHGYEIKWSDTVTLNLST